MPGSLLILSGVSTYGMLPPTCRAGLPPQLNLSGSILKHMPKGVCPRCTVTLGATLRQNWEQEVGSCQETDCGSRESRSQGKQP